MMSNVGMRVATTCSVRASGGAGGTNGVRERPKAWLRKRSKRSRGMGVVVRVAEHHKEKETNNQQQQQQQQHDVGRSGEEEDMPFLVEVDNKTDKSHTVITVKVRMSHAKSMSVCVCVRERERDRQTEVVRREVLQLFCQRERGRGGGEDRYS